MFSFTGDNLPVGIIFLAVVFAFLCYAATGVFSEFSRRNALLKDLQIIKLLRENPENAEGLRAASEYEAKVVKRIDNYNHGTSKVALTLGFLVRWVPYLFITLIMWAVMQGFAIYNSTFSIVECVASFIVYCLWGLAFEGAGKLLSPWVPSLSDRLNNIGRKKN